MPNTRVLQPVGAEKRKQIKEAKGAMIAESFEGNANGYNSVAAAAPQEALRLPALRTTRKAPRIHFFRGTFKLFGQSMNTCFAGLFAVELLAVTIAFSLLVVPNTLSLLFAAFISFGMICMGLYDARQRETVFGVLFRLLAALGVALVLSVITVNTLGHWPIAGFELIHATSWSFLLLVGLRYCFHMFVDGRVLRRRVLIMGTGKRARFVESLRRKSDQRGFELVGFVPTNTCQHCYVNTNNLLTLDTGLCEYALENEIDEIVIALDDRRAGLPIDDLLDCRMSGINVTRDLDFFEREESLVQLDLIQPGWLIHAEGFNSNTFRYWEKRIFDILGATALLVLLAPVMLFTALAILLECGFGAPLMYRQERVGRGGRPFTLLKFRSMCVNAESGGEAQWAAKQDPRVTRVGGVIRKYRFDEIPQLWNVLKGEMSLVGPRPERPQFVDDLSQENAFYPERHRIAPGLTGWAQLCFPYGASQKDSIQKLKFDLYYIKNHGLMFDFYILAQTIEVVLFQRGSR